MLEAATNSQFRDRSQKQRRPGGVQLEDELIGTKTNYLEIQINNISNESNNLLHSPIKELVPMMNPPFQVKNSYKIQHSATRKNIKKKHYNGRDSSDAQPK